MRKYLAFLIAVSAPSAAIAEDTRMPELFHLLAAAQACKIEMNISALHFINGFGDKVDRKASDALGDKIKAEVDAEIAEKGAVTVCWNAWDKMRDNGFLQPYYPTLPNAAAKP